MTLVNASIGCGLLLIAGSAIAGPPVSGHIDPVAKWVVHVDLEQLNSTEIGSFLMDMVAAETDDFEDIREVMPNFWPGPKGGMFGVTLYGSELEFEDDEVPEDFCAVIYGNEQIRGWGSMLEAIALHEGFEDKLKKREIHGADVWSMPMDEGGRIYAGLVEGRGDRVAWVVSFDSDRIERSLAFFEDKGGGNELLPRDGWRDGTVAFMATNAVGDVPMDRKASKVIGEAKSFKLRVGEVGKNAFLQVALDTGDSERAKSVMGVAQGLMAIGQLAAAEDEELAAVMRVARGLELSTSGTSVLVDFEHDAGEIVEFLRESGEFDVDVDNHFDRDDDDDDDHDEDDAW
ncbi:MAG: hypothetical protein KDA31_01455 [Phycisphaerales bacterium]|nr:hypothetical protein [Phycisphaerales bacterium]MCB9836034.1 hypothetical protein [Phycisphaera sp.]